MSLTAGGAGAGPTALVAACIFSTAAYGVRIGDAPVKVTAIADIHKIQHVIVIMQENRSFDSYFGTYPGADGIPMDSSGVPTVCVPNPAKGRCDRPFHD